MSVEPCGDEDEIWFKLFSDREKGVMEDVQAVLIFGAGFQGEVHGIADGGAGTGFMSVTCSGITSCGVLMDAAEKDGVVGVEAMLSAVAVMDVPIQDENFT